MGPQRIPLWGTENGWVTSSLTTEPSCRHALGQERHLFFFFFFTRSLLPWWTDSKVGLCCSKRATMLGFYVGHIEYYPGTAGIIMELNPIYSKKALHSQDAGPCFPESSPGWLHIRLFHTKHDNKSNLSELSYKSVKTPIISSQGNNTTKVLFKLITRIPKHGPNEPSFCPELTKRKGLRSGAVITAFPFKLLTGDRCCILRPIDLQLAWLSC